MNIKLILSILSLVLAFVFTHILQGSGVEMYVVSVLTFVGSYFGIDWRKQYEDLKNWFKSKTILGALLIAIPTLVLLLAALFSVALPPEVVTFIEWIIAAGGLSFIIGVVHRLAKDAKEDV